MVICISHCKKERRGKHGPLPYKGKVSWIRMLQTKSKSGLCSKDFRKRTRGLTFLKLNSVEPAQTQGHSWEESAPSEASSLNCIILTILLYPHLVRCSRSSYFFCKSVGVYHGNNCDTWNVPFPLFCVQVHHLIIVNLSEWGDLCVLIFVIQCLFSMYLRRADDM